MGEVVGAGFLSHVPTIMLPEAQRREMNNGNEISLVPGLKRLRAEVLDDLCPDVVIVFDTHWFSLFEFIVTAHKRREGIYTSEEVPRGLNQVHYDMPGDPELAQSLASHATDAGTRCTANADPQLPVNYGTVNIANYLNRGEKWLSVSICQTATHEDFLAAGRGFGDAIRASDSRIVLIASGSLSHRFYPMKELDQHESSDPNHVITPEARSADEQRISWWEHGDHAAVVDSMDDFMRHRPEGLFGHYLMMIAAIGGAQCTAVGRRFSEYENAIGTGQVHMWFDQPVTGWI
jgi:3,4-dihydroxyphenylacetate 2,3-dioxygenase